MSDRNIQNQSAGDGAPLIINGGIHGVTITGGAGGEHGDGGAVILTAGRGGDVINHPVSSYQPSSQPKKQWFEKPIGVVLLGLVVTGLAYYFGWH